MPDTAAPRFAFIGIAPHDYAVVVIETGETIGFASLHDAALWLAGLMEITPDA